MRALTHQGESQSIAIIIRDEDNNTIDISNILLKDLKVFLVHSPTGKVLAKYSYKYPSDDFLSITTSQSATTGEYYSLIRVSEEETEHVPVGDIDVQVNLYVPKLGYSDQTITKVYKGKMAKMLKATRWKV
jgi:hypothetical protein